MHETKKLMVCVQCGQRIDATLRQARHHGWTLWVGGARCRVCAEKLMSLWEEQAALDAMKERLTAKPRRKD